MWGLCHTTKSINQIHLIIIQNKGFQRWILSIFECSIMIMICRRIICGLVFLLVFQGAPSVLITNNVTGCPCLLRNNHLSGKLFSSFGTFLIQGMFNGKNLQDFEHKKINKHSRKLLATKSGPTWSLNISLFFQLWIFKNLRLFVNISLFIHQGLQSGGRRLRIRKNWKLFFLNWTELNNYSLFYKN